MKRFLNFMGYVLITATAIAIIAWAFVAWQPPAHVMKVSFAGNVVNVTAKPGAFNAPDITQLDTNIYTFIVSGYHSFQIGQKVWLHDDTTGDGSCISLDDNSTCFPIFK